MDTFKCVVVGDGAVGKTAMLATYTGKRFPESYTPTAFDTTVVNVFTRGRNFLLELNDTAGQEDYDRLRSLGYFGTDVILVCFSIACPTSFQNTYEKWVPEVSKYCKGKPFVLIGTKTDLRADQETLDKLYLKRENPISLEQGQALARAVNATKYVECSSLTQHGLHSVFKEAVLAVLNGPPVVKKRKCTIL